MEKDAVMLYDYACRLKGTERIIVQQGLMSASFDMDEAFKEAKKNLSHGHGHGHGHGHSHG